MTTADTQLNSWMSEPDSRIFGSGGNAVPTVLGSQTGIKMHIPCLDCGLATGEWVMFEGYANRYSPRKETMSVAYKSVQQAHWGGKHNNVLIHYGAEPVDVEELRAERLGPYYKSNQGEEEES